MMKLDEILKAIDDKMLADAKSWGYDRPSTSYEVYDEGNLADMMYVTFYISGDWKHDHGYFDYVLGTLPNFYKVQHTDVEDTGSDWYGCKHTVLFSEHDEAFMKGLEKLFA